MIAGVEHLLKMHQPLRWAGRLLAASTDREIAAASLAAFTLVFVSHTALAEVWIRHTRMQRRRRPGMATTV